MYAVWLESNIAQNFLDSWSNAEKNSSSCERQPQNIMLSVFACTRWPTHTLQSLHIQKNFHKVCEVMIHLYKIAILALVNEMHFKTISTVELVPAE